MGRHDEHLVCQPVRAAGEDRLPRIGVGRQQRIDLGLVAEPLAEHPRVDRPHARQVGDQPAGRHPSARLQVRPRRQRHRRCDRGQLIASGRDRALREQLTSFAQARAWPQEREPLVRQLTRHPDGRRRQGRQRDRDA